MSEDHPDPGLSGELVRKLVHQAVLIAAADGDGSLVACDVETAMAEIVILAQAIDQIDTAIAARLAVANAGKGHQLSAPSRTDEAHLQAAPGQSHPTSAARPAAWTRRR
ncbi:hypothetical protein [Acrocarpospora macrocephala]|nr:hypothetical protein [Acrocarpospora macrocephala]